jgi:hypothetical protein
MARLLALSLITSLSALSACDQRTDSGAAPGDSTPLSAQPVLAVDSGTAGRTQLLVRVPWAPFGEPAPDTVDFGTGIVALTVSFDDTARTFPLEDTLIFRDAPRADAPVIGALIVARSDRMSWSTAGLVPAGTRLNFREYGYEEAGVPTDTTDETGRWVRGILAFTPEKDPVRGWASLDAPWVKSLAWADRLAEHVSFFFNPSRARLFATLADARAGQGGEPLPPAERLEIEEILERNAQWLRVRIRWPYEACSDSKENTQTREAWIRYLDDRGRPLVFYPTRGC